MFIRILDEPLRAPSWTFQRGDDYRANQHQDLGCNHELSRIWIPGKLSASSFEFLFFLSVDNMDKRWSALKNAVKNFFRQKQEIALVSSEISLQINDDSECHFTLTACEVIYELQHFHLFHNKL